jgi:hypothetical protein
MTVLAETQARPVGILQAWESETSYPDETPFVSEIGPVNRVRDFQGLGWFTGISVEDVTPLIAGLRLAAIPGGVGRVWAPWSFISAVNNLVPAISGFGFQGNASESAILASGASGVAITVLAGSGILPFTYTGQTAMTATSWSPVEEVRLLLPGFAPGILRVREAFWEASGHSWEDPRLSDTMAAIRDLTRWLNRSQSEIADICRFSLRASRYWGSGKTKAPRPATVRRLHEVHSFVGSLVDAVGRQRARQWLDRPLATGKSRLDVLATPDGVTTLLREASHLLFAEAPRGERPRPESVEAVEASDVAEEYEPLHSRSAARRPRRAPRHGE